MRLLDVLCLPQPRGPALRLLDLIDRKGLDVIL